MPAGKAASQACHAILGSHLDASGHRQDLYAAEGMGTKIVLGAPDLGSLEELMAWCKQEGLPHYLVVDSGNNTTFGGVTTTSALGVGPLFSDEEGFMQHLSLY